MNSTKFIIFLIVSQYQYLSCIATKNGKTDPAANELIPPKNGSTSTSVEAVSADSGTTIDFADFKETAEQMLSTAESVNVTPSLTTPSKTWERQESGASDLTMSTNTLTFFYHQERDTPMRDPEGFLLKPNVRPREIDFYENLQTAEDPQLKELKLLSSKYAGITIDRTNNEETTFTRIEDITRDFNLPCIMNVKIGKQTWEPDAQPKKILLQKLKYVAMRERWGFGITGYQYYDILNEKFVKFGRAVGRKMKPEEGIAAIYNFVNGKLGLELGLVNKILEKLETISSWFEVQRHFHFYGSSILIAYDASRLWKDAIDSVDSIVRIRMIDFSHVISSRDGTKDENYTYGLGQLIDVFQKLELLHEEMTNLEPEEKKSRTETMSRTKEYKNEDGSSSTSMMGHSEMFVSKLDSNAKEANFYENLEKSQDSVLEDLKQFTLKYGGRMEEKSKKRNEVITRIKLENITRNFVSACYIHIKIGEQTWEPGASERIILVKKVQYMAMREYYGFYILGTHYYDVDSRKRIKREPSSFYNMKPQDGFKTIYNFVNGELGLQSKLVSGILIQLQKISLWFERQRHYNFYDSAIAIAYDASCLDKGEDPRVQVRMMDFAHVVPNTTNVKDENYLHGLVKLIEVFENLGLHSIS